MTLFSKNKLLKANYNLHPILQNQLVLYFFFFLTIVDMFYLANLRDYSTLSFIILTGFLTSFFSKNMIVILCIALCVGNALKYGTGKNHREGAENMKNNSDSADLKETNDVSNDDTKPSATKEKNTTIDAKKKAKEDLLKGLKEFQSVQNDLVSGLEKMQPMLDKAEAFVEKYENYKNINGNK
jgi:hypothetical protein